MSSSLYDVSQELFGKGSDKAAKYGGSSGNAAKMRYGTAVSDMANSKLEVRLDGSEASVVAECHENVKAGQRVTLISSGGTYKVLCLADGSIGGNLFTADSAYFDKLFANEGFFNKLFADEAFIGKLWADQAFIGHLEADYAKIDTLEANYAKIETLEAQDAKIENLEATKASIGYLDANYAKIDYSETGEAVIRDAKIDVANVRDISAQYATTNFGNVDVEWVDKFYAEDGSLDRVDIAKGYITSAHIADATITDANIAHLTGDVFEAETIKADKLLLLGDDGEYGVVDAINTHTAVLRPGVMDVADLNAFEATIGGFEIDQKSIHSRLNGANKSAPDDPTPGVYVGLDGIGVGDGTFLGNSANVPAAVEDSTLVLDGATASVDGSTLAITGHEGSPFMVFADGTPTFQGKNSFIRINNVTGEVEMDVSRFTVGTHSVITSEDLDEFATSTTAKLDALEKIADGEIDTWFYEGVPTLSNLPAVNWTTKAEREAHLGDLYYDTLSQIGYRFMRQDPVTGDMSLEGADPNAPVLDPFVWKEMGDDPAVRALAIAQTAQDTADHKRRVFVAQPTVPYDVGDLWADGTNIRRCMTARASGSYNASDWGLASAYQTKAQVDTAITTSAGEISAYVDKKVGDESKERSELSIKLGQIETKVSTAEGSISSMKQGPSGFSWSVASTSDVNTAKSAAEKTATNYMDFNVTNSGALTIGNRGGNWANCARVVIGNGSVDIRNNGNTSVANYGATCRVGIASYGNVYTDSNSVSLRNGSTSLAKIFNPGGADAARFEVYGGAGTCYLYSQVASGGYKGMYGSGHNIISDKGSNIYIGTTNSVVGPMSSGESLGNSSSKWADLYTSVLHCTGNASITGTVYYGGLSASSSIKVKDNVETLTDQEAARLLEVRPVSFDYKEGFGGKDRRGVIAEEVEEHLPYLITESEDGIKGVDYTGFIAPLIKLCQMQQEQINELTKRVESLEKGE